MKKIIKTIIKIVKSLIFIPHIASYLLINRSKRILVNKDIDAEKNRNQITYNRIIALLFYLQYSPYYRKIFYKRIGMCSYLLSWYSPGEKTFLPYANIGGGVYPSHSFATILNAKSIGENFTFRNCTTVGSKKDGHNELVPTILDNVILGANVCIIGDITIGNNVIVGAGSVVIHSVPDNCVVAGNPARFIKKNPDI